ncbi:photosystem II protein Psb27 [Geitlerinema sp. PCC 7407]|uniref:photosystem II protein Psb27 n=1 Tax=Geitlerinema sp. PCC 7407 TaxID=1173025 RepID=UPI00029F880F|nr:photosystem II protein Psb27 [Geitlerinema sp. PCC 7407]AFY64744.1 photosystem II protein Psb27 [Geitlerinema sp. PCC 7407]
MKRFFSHLLALALVVVIGLTGCSAAGGGASITGNYRQDSLELINSLRTAITLPEDAPNKAEAQADARQRINEFVSRYRRDTSVTTLGSFTTMRTALNGLAGHYSSYPNRPIPKKLMDRLEQEFDQVEMALRREA